MKISLILVNWNSWEYARRCLRSAEEELTGLSHEIFFIDNHSDKDETEDFRREFQKLSVVFIRNNSNLGFAAAVNQGLNLCQGEIIFLVNPDTEIRPGVFSVLMQYLKRHPEAGLAGPRLLNSDGTLQKWTAGSFPSVISAINHYFFLSSLSCRFKGIFLGRDYIRPQEVDWLCGAFLAVRRSMLEQIGFLDERFFMYAEDMDWCLRAKAKGWKSVYVPDAEVLHHAGKSMEKAKKERFWRGLFSIRSFYARQSRSGIAVFLFDAVTALGYILRSILFGLKAVLVWRADAQAKAWQSFQFAKAALAILFGLHFLYRVR